MSLSDNILVVLSSRLARVLIIFTAMSGFFSIMSFMSDATIRMTWDELLARTVHVRGLPSISPISPNIVPGSVSVVSRISSL